MTVVENCPCQRVKITISLKLILKSVQERNISLKTENVTSENEKGRKKMSFTKASLLQR